MRKQIVLIFTILVLLNCTNQKENSSWKYFNQLSPGNKAVLFAPEIINHKAHSSLSFSPDGKEIYWSTVSDQNESRKIYFSNYKNNKWSKPKVVSFSGQFHDDHPFITANGEKMFFASKRPKVDKGEEENDIWIANKAENGWNKVEPMKNLIGFWTPTLTQNETLYYLDIVSGYKRNCAICRIKLNNGEYTNPEVLPESINGRESLDWCPFISADESYLIFSSDREGGYGAGDLYISFRTQEDEWLTPINMGKSINTDRQERFPGVSPDGKYLFFTRWLSEPNLHDLYWIDAKIIDSLRSVVTN